jgi:hypothetical protein
LNERIPKLAMLSLIIICTILISRVLLLLFAARPDNVSVALILAVSAPFAWPLSWMDVYQPVFGARFERGTLISAVLCIVGLFLIRKKIK